MKDVRAYRVEITTGQYKTAPPEQKEMIQRLLGENAEYDFEIYFHWYNVLHELGHVILDFNAASRPHPVDEEPLVNDFAVSYWRHYGEPEKCNALYAIVREAIGRFTAPTQQNYMDYAKELWGKEALYNFNNYGWFQFSCVQNAIAKNQTLEQVMKQMGLVDIYPQKKTVLEYSVNDRTPFRVVDEAVKVLVSWGVSFPKDLRVLLSNDPNCHMCQSIKICAE